MYETGDGTRQNYEQAVTYLNIAAQYINEAALHLGIIYEEGLGVAQNYAEAFKNYKRAINSDSNDARLRLGRLYEEGLGTERNVKEAIRLYKRPFNSGNVDAGLKIGYLLMETGDLKEAVRTFEKLAESDCAMAAMELYRIFSDNAELRDKKKAWHYVQQAARLGDVEAMDILDQHMRRQVCVSVVPTGDLVLQSLVRAYYGE